MGNIGHFLNQLSELTQKVPQPKGPWMQQQVTKPEGPALCFGFGFTMVPSQQDPRILTKAPVMMTLPGGNIELNLMTGEQADAFFMLVMQIPALSQLVFEFRKTLVELATMLEREAYSAEAKKAALEVQKELAEGPEPSRIITL